jgi:hypothetical protein
MIIFVQDLITAAMNTITIPAGTAPAWTDGNVLSMPVMHKKHTREIAQRFAAMQLRTKGYKFNRDEANQR